MVIGGADYHFIETSLLPPESRSYPEDYWNKRVMAPSCILFYMGINKRLPQLLHHCLFFDTSFEEHSHEMYSYPQWPTDPLFYLSATSLTDNTVAPAGCENLFILIPVAAGLAGDTDDLRNHYLEIISDRLERHTRESIKDSIVYCKFFASRDFAREYNSYKGNAYGLANTLLQTAVLKPGCRSKKIKNLCERF